MSLEEYLEHLFNLDQQDIKEIEKEIRDVGKMFAVSFNNDTAGWPYVLKANDSPAKTSSSQGTSAMILAAIGKVVGSCTMRDGTNSEYLPELRPELKKQWEVGCQKLADLLTERVSHKSADGEEYAGVFSGTFGKNDPLTISHLAEICRGVLDGAQSTLTNNIKHKTAAQEKIQKLISADPNGGEEFSDLLKDKSDNDNTPWCAGSAFIALRIIRSECDFDLSGDTGKYRDFFESKLHEQLSYSSIPDSRFDPAELAFCLEGLLLCAEESVDPVLFKRVMEVLAAGQETSAYWRPNRPFKANARGELMLPLSVEGANSLLRSVEIMDGQKLFGTFSEAAIPMFRRFWEWLRARKVELNLKKSMSHLGGWRSAQTTQVDEIKEFWEGLRARKVEFPLKGSTTSLVGWHSEHINDVNEIHLWDTSQVLEFLLAFRKLLKRHSARETLVRSRLAIDEPVKINAWDDTNEPLADDEISDRVFEKVKEDFVDKWRKHDTKKNYSMLLYGPPGTGKTAIAKSIANALGFRLITVTVSDFLGGGGALVEARAKAIFQVLEAQTDCVILFDEVDAFLLDRDSKHYTEQDTLFQFLTPGMLTKINNLRAKEKSIFIIATNYANRIDPAIKRPGRIDREYLLLSPDLETRKKIISGFLIKSEIDPGCSITKMGEASLYLGYKEMEAAIGKLAKSATPEEVVAALESEKKSNSLEHYLARLGNETTFPTKEFLASVKMANQAGQLKRVQSAIDGLGSAKKALTKALDADLASRAALADLGIEI